RQAEDKEAIDTLFVTDEQRRLEGVIGLRDILTGHDDALIGELMKTDVMSAKTHDDQAMVAEMFKKYDLLTMPVVDNENRLVGLITIDDVIDVIEAETTEDIELMAAITPSDKPYLKTGAVELWKRRIPWLLILMISATFTGIIITRFESALATCVALTAFIPMLMDTGGNSGSQSSVTVIRGISLGELGFSDLPCIIWKEFRVAMMCGLTLAVCNFVKLMLIDRVSVLVAGVVCFTLVFTVLVAKIVGCILPMVAEKIGFDPAVMASPFITTIVDAISLIIYFQMATLLLGL
ncbi:MAG: magnesium transporter, partial [Oscillospiraceae bacterium]